MLKLKLGPHDIRGTVSREDIQACDDKLQFTAGTLLQKKFDFKFPTLNFCFRH